MKYLLESSKFNQIDRICKKFDIKKYTVNGDGSIDVDGDVNLTDRELLELPLEFGIVSGGFYCSHNKLNTLKGAPKKVGGNFYCYCNQLISLEGSPEEVGGDFYCHNNKLTSLVGAPREVGANFHCSNNRLTSLRGAPEEVGVNFYCYGNQLTSLVGAPRKLGGGFYCSNNPLPKLILDNMAKIKEIIKNQEDYSIWRRDGTIDEFRFREMMRDI